MSVADSVCCLQYCSKPIFVLFLRPSASYRPPCSGKSRGLRGVDFCPGSNGRPAIHDCFPLRIPTRFGGIIPGSEVVAPVSSVCAAANVGDYILRGVATGIEPRPWVLVCMRERALGRARAEGGIVPRLTPAELDLGIAARCCQGQ